ncbi:Uncharacterised protein [Klebsiella pneumoniae]|nr:Uncharacterised protein [Klebsiella pneumoniae]
MNKKLKSKLIPQNLSKLRFMLKTKNLKKLLGVWLRLHHYWQFVWGLMSRFLLL